MSRNFLFGVDQVAGGEYILPLLERWRAGGPEVVVYGSEVCARLLGPRGFTVRKLAPPTPETARSVLISSHVDGVVLNASIGSVVEQSFLEAAASAGIPSFQFVDAWVNVVERFQLDRLPSRIAVADESMRRQLVEARVPAERIEVVGLPFLETKLRGGSKERYRGSPKAVIVTQPVAQNYGTSLGYDEHSFVRTCLEAWRDLGHPDSNLLLLAHPAEDPTSYRDLLPAAVEVVQNVPLGDLPHSVVLGMFSSLLVECVVLGLPAISVQPTPSGRNLCALVDAGYVPLARTRSQLAQLLRQIECGAPLNGTGPEEFRRVILGSLDRFEGFLLKGLPGTGGQPK